MEFFEKAHSFKVRDKLGEKMKKQLKQMLHGYNKNDNDLIRKSGNIMDITDDSSVSGFSDLSLSNSNSYNESTKATLDSSDLDSVSNLVDEDFPQLSQVDEVDKGTNDLTNVDDLISTRQNYLEMSSETIDDSSLASGNLSILCSSVEPTTDSDSSSQFDADGVLASKIHEKLNEGNIQRDKLKRKRDNNQKSSTKNSNCVEKYNSLSKSEPKQRQAKTLKSGHIESTPLEIDTKQNANKHYILSDDKRILYTMTPSPTFVSVAAENINTEQFNDILGHYRYATVKNISADQSNVSFSTFDTSNLLKDVESEIDSLAPELGTEVNLSSVDLTEADSSVEVQNESDVVNEDLNQSNAVIDLEESIEKVESPVVRHEVFNGINCTIIVLRHPADLFIHGKVVVKKLGGSAQLYGYSLQEMPCEVYAPYYNYAHCLQTVQNNNNYYGLFNKLTTRGVSVVVAEQIVTTLGSYDVVVALEKVRNFAMDFVESNFQTLSNNLFTKSSDNIEPSLKSASEYLGCSLYSSQPYKHLEESANWQQAVQFGLSDGSRGIVCGGKGAGKSTFLRYYVNQLLSKGPVLVIDLDPGQCEFTVAGSISATVVTEPLLGPNYTHLRKPEIMLNLGMISTMDNPRLYVTAVEDLVARCADDERLRCLPWIVNTMGMCNAIGLKFITFIILRIRPTFLLQIELHSLKKNFEFLLTPQKVEELHKLYKNDRIFANLSRHHQLSYSYISSPAESYRVNKGNVSDNFSLAPRDERYLNFLAYFGKLANIHKSMQLLHIKPYSARLQDLYVATNIKLQSELITKVLNGKIVALCQHSSERDMAVFTLSDKPLLCYGHGLVRGIDKDVIYLITPISPNELSIVDTILYADWVPDLRGQEKYLPGGTVVPYRLQSEYQQRQYMFAPRRRFNPLQLLKMTRNS
ncbi:polynucleotide 5'-hydroxyl-kinase NOL9 [Battus philenor]|uniref:polynucleotide 5'-hydroxyl-kinase NOL9 n=1 Tax=Battus philenor TaxID=42288 RepID=UPI0035D015C0